MKDIYVVYSVMDSGSASLTFPEDFSFAGYYEKEKDAQEHVERENAKNGIADFGHRESENEEDDEEDEDCELTNEMVYTYEKLSNLKKMNTKSPT